MKPRIFKLRMWHRTRMWFHKKDEYLKHLILFNHDYSLFTLTSKENCVFMQFIGIKDIHGKEVYEGDIVRITNGDLCNKVGFVDFADASFRINLGYIKCYSWVDYEVEVLGNIYEHPNLLKQHEED